MRRSRIILIKSIIIILLSLAVWSSFTYYLPLKQVHEWYAYELTIARGISIGLLNTLFYGIVLVINIRAYKITFISLAVLGIVAWNISHLNDNLDLGLLSTILKDLLEIILFISTAVIAPGMVVFIVYYIKKYTTKFEGNFIGSYHLHEGFFGIILVGLAIFMLVTRTIIRQFEVFLNELKIILAIIMILLYFLLFFGGFFIFRDIKDVVRLKFIKKMEKSAVKEEQHSPIFSSITQANLSFFKVSKFPIFPIGIFITSMSFSMIIYGSKFIPREMLSSEFVINYGYLLSFLAGGIIGFDWIRIFKWFYPKNYVDIEQRILMAKKHGI